ncbi:MAG TPA: 3,4-dihydroxy-2-butanone-4-phosphate synthase [Saprospiraceae bacterium]|nr:3,4-dihydroxy-2-butanone-4-phosphate synthase [Saprospiraceae bacterium]
MTQTKIKLNTIQEAIDDIRKGKIIIVVDDEDRENEGDFICAAEMITPETVNFMSKYGRGLICTPLQEERAKELQLEMMVRENTALHETAFTVSIDLIGYGCTTGISAFDRSKGIKAITDPKFTASDFARPGHIFPLISKKGGVLRRTGHTEAAVDFAKLAGFYPAGVLVEILNEDGSMARLPELIEIADRHGLMIVSIKDLVAYRMENERIVKRVQEKILNTDLGKFKVTAFRQLTTGDIHLAISTGEIRPDVPTMVRVHSSTETGDILGILFENYGVKLKKSLEMIAENQSGVLLYMRHSEKSESILQKLSDIEQSKNINKSSSDEQRDFGTGAQILRELGVQKIKLITNSVVKRVALPGYGLEIVETVTIPE